MPRLASGNIRGLFEADLPRLWAEYRRHKAKIAELDPDRPAAEWPLWTAGAGAVRMQA